MCLFMPMRTREQMCTYCRDLESDWRPPHESQSTYAGFPRRDRPTNLLLKFDEPPYPRNGLLPIEDRLTQPHLCLTLLHPGIPTGGGKNWLVLREFQGNELRDPLA